MKVIITQRARSDLLELFDYNSKISLSYAIRIDKKIRSYIEVLQDFRILVDTFLKYLINVIENEFAKSLESFILF